MPASEPGRPDKPLHKTNVAKRLRCEAMCARAFVASKHCHQKCVAEAHVNLLGCIGRNAPWVDVQEPPLLKGRSLKTLRMVSGQSWDWVGGWMGACS